jgi:hypothetical protein
MTNRKWLAGGAAFLGLVLVMTCVAAFAAGTKSDPMLSLSYVTEEFKPQIVQKINEAVKEATDGYQDTITAQFSQLQRSVDQQLGSLSGGVDVSALTNNETFINAIADAVIAKLPAGGASGGASSGYSRVDIKKGQTVTFELGAEIVIRLGSATVVATSSPGLVDLTTAGGLDNGKTLEKNHHYLCTIADRGVKAAEDSTLFLRGGYTVT